jgi:RND family efflux transporter MFP subunit
MSVFWSRLTQSPYLLGGVLLGIGVLSLPLWMPKSQANQPTAPQAIPVVIEPLAKHAILDASSYLGEVVSDKAIMLFSEEKGRIAHIFVADGQTVHAGQPLFQLFSGQQKALVQSLGASALASQQETAVLSQQIKALQAEKQGVQASLTFNKTQLGRFQQLATDDTVAVKESEQYATTVAELAKKLSALDATIAANKQRQTQVNQTVSAQRSSQRAASIEEQRYTVKAPFTGTIGEIKTKVGDVVDNQVALATLTNGSQNEVAIALPAQQAHKVKKGGVIRILDETDALLAKTTVAFKSPFVDEASQTVLVKAPLRGGQFLPMQKVKTQFVWQQLSAITVPVSAVFRMAGQPFVYIAKPAEGQTFTAKLHPVTLGSIQGNSYQLLTPLPKETKIITQGIQKLQEGALVMQLPTQQPSQPQQQEAH